jgi:oxygen-independent coproporphyrinogen-3 oxidase
MSLPLSLYIHIPWCIRKCPYCDFNSHKSPEKLPEEDYIRALIADLKNDLSNRARRPLESIFIGGGTPSLLSARAYDLLFNELYKLISFKDAIEITIEANPGTVEQARFKAYRALGINRLSLGIQSFNPVHLKSLGRIHDDKQAHHAIENARLAGFDNINLDIMHGLPQQTIAEGLSDLAIAIAYQPEHLSWYQLTIEPNTIFYKKRPSLPNEDDAFMLEEEGLHLLKASGFKRYEISAFCRNDKMASHNLNYWLFGDYLGIGAGAHGKLTLGKNIIRTRKQRQPVDYLNADKPYLAETVNVSEQDRIFEFMLNATRLQQAIPHFLFTERTGLPFESLNIRLKKAAAKGMIMINEETWQITPLGRRYTNDLQEIFLE